MAVTPKRRWYQFSLKRLLVLLTASAVCTWFINRAHEQREAVRILREGYPLGEILYEGNTGLWDEDPYESGQTPFMVSVGWISEFPPGRFPNGHEDAQPTGFRRVQNWIGEDYFLTVAAVNHYGGEEDRKISTQEWQAISRLHCLKGLSLDYVESIHDDHLTWLEHLTSLERLFLEGTSIGDHGLENLAGLTNLRYLSLASTKVTDAGLIHLRNLSRLEMLELRDTGITDAGLVHLRLLKGPTTIYLSGTKVTERGAKELQAALPNCKVSLVPPVNCPIDEYKGPPPRGGFF